LAIKGYRVLEAIDGRQGVDLAFEQRPGLILMDIQLPKMDGFEALRILRNDAGTREIPIWVLTASAMRDDAERIRSCGCDDYITKPFDLPDLLARIERLFGPAADDRDGAERPDAEAPQ
jgi:two-component system cell cycle response regulator DivK